MAKESRIEAKAIEALKAKGAIALKVTVLVGIPDRVVIWGDGNAFFIEFKTKTGVVSKAQKYWANRLPANVYYCRSVDDALRALKHERMLYDGRIVKEIA